MMVSALRAGHSLQLRHRHGGQGGRRAGGEGIQEVFRRAEFRRWNCELRCMNLVTRVPIDDVRMIVTAILIQKESGGNLAEILEKAAHIIRDRFRLKRQIRVHTAQGRMTGWILSILPVVLGLVLYMVNPEHHEPVVEDDRSASRCSIPHPS